MNNKTIEKQKIEAIFPLSSIQLALLFHHIAAKEDQGFLNVQCTIDGLLNIPMLKKAWNLAIERHAVLRTSVHWKNIKNPVQIVRPSGVMQWHILDWSGDNLNEQNEKLNQLKIDNKKAGVDFNKNPLSKIHIIKVNSKSNYLVWSCHHLLLDGWSGSIILKDVFSYYDGLINNKKIELETIPAFKSYLNYLKRSSPSEANLYWNRIFKGLKKPVLINKSKSAISTLDRTELELDIVNKVKDLTKSFQITPNTLFQGIWSLIISRYTNSKDIIFGNTVSGRSNDFPNIELMAGMFANVLPIRSTIDNSAVKDWMKNMQKNQIESRKYEHYAVAEIAEIIKSSSIALFDSLFIFENYPWENIKSGDLRVHSSNSGITTTYPLTLVVKMQDSIKIDLLSEASIFNKEIITWILNRFEEIIDIIAKNSTISIDALFEKITPIKHYDNIITPKTIVEKNGTHPIKMPKTKTESELLKIWKDLLNKNNIGTSDNFFEIGGNSILSVQIISKARKLGLNISPNDLFENQSIVELANFIEHQKVAKNLKSYTFKHVVGIKKTGSLPPLFCIHGGGSHFFFYNALGKYANPERPVYAVQASGVEDTIILHDSIERMATEFLKEIKLVTPKGPYHIMGYCYNTAVALEICRILKQENQTVNLIIADTMAKNQERFDPSKTKRRVSGFIKRLIKNPFNAIYLFSKSFIESYLTPLIKRIFGSKLEKKVQTLRDKLSENYLNYSWTPFDDNISLLITESNDPTENPEKIGSWNKISNKEVKLTPTKGHHSKLFQEPLVRHTSQQLETCMSNFETNFDETS